ncbi:MAG: hypothetical protein HY330_04885, partial [Chloroflexi bacterium]|nr:hypothetical protein [Chloroflexota bacterium]
MIDLVGKRYWYFVFSLAIIIPGVISLLIPPALKPGIEFSAGTTMVIQFERPVAEASLVAELSAQGHPEAVPQRQTPVSEVAILVGTETLNQEPEKVRQRLSRQFGKLSEFTPGALLQVQFGKPVPEAELRAELTRLGHPEAALERQAAEGGELWRIALKSLVAPVTKQELKEKEPGEEAKLRQALVQRFGELREFAARDVLTVGFEGAVTAAQLRDELAAQGHPEASVTLTEPSAEAPPATGSAFAIELARLGPPRPAYGDNPAESAEAAKLQRALVERFGPLTRGEARSQLVAQFFSAVTLEEVQAELQAQGQASAQVTFEALPNGLRYSIATP